MFPLLNCVEQIAPFFVAEGVELGVQSVSLMAHHYPQIKSNTCDEPRSGCESSSRTNTGTNRQKTAETRTNPVHIPSKCSTDVPVSALLRCCGRCQHSRHCAGTTCLEAIQQSVYLALKSMNVAQRPTTVIRPIVSMLGTQPTIRKFAATVMSPTCCTHKTCDLSGFPETPPKSPTFARNQ